MSRRCFSAQSLRWRDTTPGRRLVRDEDALLAGDLTRQSHVAGARTSPGAAPPAGLALWQAALLHEQRTLGNAHVARAIQRAREEPAQTTPVAVSPARIAAEARASRVAAGVHPAFAGAPLAKEPPGGMAFIAKQVGEGGLGGRPAGYTAIQGAGAFTAPRFVTRVSAEKDGYKRRYFATVEPTSATDVSHPSFYPAPGTHDYAVSVQKDATYTYYWKISDTISDLIRRGEQEHLDDAQRAYDLTYALIAREINAMAGQRFGPADSPAAAEKLAEGDLARRLPPELGTDPLRWYTVLDEMLTMTLRRDREHLHDVIPGKAVERGKTFYVPLVTTEQTSVGQVSSERIVTYPSGGKTGRADGAPSAAAGAAPEMRD